MAPYILDLLVRIPRFSQLSKPLLRTFTTGSADADATGYFGKITKDAVKKFQQAKGINPLGYVGPQTRKALNE